jgi:hypothetical protein
MPSSASHRSHFCIEGPLETLHKHRPICTSQKHLFAIRRMTHGGAQFILLATYFPEMPYRTPVRMTPNCEPKKARKKLS